ncbi:hypothetical protein THAOC_30179 [Thalassiosira oceanica]|uniref:Uncharacterized protein n=1 Tax=Thalassiosira oceanica TaxID=159749 RepID=K0RPD3_THAOC|nr:hypothetical protein THAOC_30179 [Thalassiosira oceanica]|eukprot:EJK50731.1 hypothetical protein THAOC_30179 [Thalassiosira oceanica]
MIPANEDDVADDLDGDAYDGGRQKRRRKRKRKRPRRRKKQAKPRPKHSPVTPPRRHTNVRHQAAKTHESLIKEFQAYFYSDAAKYCPASGFDTNWHRKGIDLNAVLACVGAKDKMNELHLTGCTGLSGEGLEAIRGSTVLQRLHLQMWPEQAACGGPTSLEKGGERALMIIRAELESQLSREKVQPVLESMLAKDDSEIRHIAVPKHWIDGRDSRFPRLSRAEMVNNLRCGLEGVLKKPSPRIISGMHIVKVRQMLDEQK